MFCEIMMKKIAIPTREDMVDDHFGHCAYYTVVTLDDEDQVQNSERLDSPEGCGCKSNIASVMQEMGITLMLAGNMGMGAYNKLSAHGITVIRGCHGKVDDVLRSYQNGEIQDSLESCDHHDCTHHEEKPVYVIPSFANGRLERAHRQSAACSVGRWMAHDGRPYERRFGNNGLAGRDAGK